MSHAADRWAALCGEMLLCVCENEGHEAGNRRREAGLDFNDVRHMRAKWKRCARSLPAWARSVSLWNAERLPHICLDMHCYAQKTERALQQYEEQWQECLDINQELFNGGRPLVPRWRPPAVG